MQIKKRKKSDIPSAKTGPIGGPIPSANTAGSALSVTAKTGQVGSSIPSANLKGSDMSVVARLRSAKKVKEEAMAPREKKKLVGEVELGPTETQESVTGEYLKRLKKRAK